MYYLKPSIELLNIYIIFKNNSKKVSIKAAIIAAFLYENNYIFIEKVRK